MTKTDVDRPRRSRRFPRAIERELAKLFGTLGFRDYGSALWTLATDVAPAEETIVSDMPISEPIAAQILDQARHDPAVLAAGPRAMRYLARKRRSARDQHGVEVSGLFLGLSERVEVVLVVSRLDRLSDEDLRDVMAALRSAGGRSFVVVVTDGTAKSADAEAQDPGKHAPDTRIVFWRDHNAERNAANARLFALFLHALGPAVILIGDSRVGFETVGRYGRALMRFHRMVCAFAAPATDQQPPAFIRYLRAVSSHAVVLAQSGIAATALRTYGVDPEGPGIQLFESHAKLGDSRFIKQAAEVFGGDFADGRSHAGRTLATMLAPHRWKAAAAAVAGAPAVPADADASRVDITVTIVFHRERQLAVASLASLADMVRTAREAGLTIEARAMLDRPDAATRELVATRGGDFLAVEEVDFGDLGLTRNAGARMASGQFLAFVDGDDLWGPQWLHLAHRAATAEGAPAEAIWHPEDVYLFHEEDFDVRTDAERPHPSARSTHYAHRSSLDADYDPRDALLENHWSANAFALTETFRRFRYRSNEWAWQAGIEDWRWNLETLGAKIPHLVVKDTVHIIRIKDTGSLSIQSDSRGLLPILT